jgi:tetratricopeptide (TPR) repeat protein
MLKFQPLVTTGAALCLVLPAAVLGGDGDFASLTTALRETDRALDVLRGIDAGTTKHSDPAAVLRSVTETPIADGQAREARLELLRNEVGLLQTELDSLDTRAIDPAAPMPPAAEAGQNLVLRPADSSVGSAVSPGTGPMTGPASTSPATTPITTGLTDAQRAALFGDPSAGASSSSAGGARAPKDPRATAGAQQGTGSDPRPVRESTEDPGYSADPLRHANTLYRAGRYQEGFALITALKSPEAVYLQARFLEKLGRVDEAIAAIESVIDQLPEGYEARRAKSDLEFFRWKRDFLKRLPEAGVGGEVSK